jgi:hypothetical protein
MQLSPLSLSGREKRLSLWLGAASLCFGVFVKITAYTAHALGNDSEPWKLRGHLLNSESGASL